MQLEKPDRVHIQARDGRTKETRSRTVYNVTLDEVDRLIDSMFKPEPEKPVVKSRRLSTAGT